LFVVGYNDAVDVLAQRIDRFDDFSLAFVGASKDVSRREPNGRNAGTEKIAVTSSIVVCLLVSAIVVRMSVALDDNRNAKLWYLDPKIRDVGTEPALLYDVPPEVMEYAKSLLHDLLDR